VEEAENLRAALAQVAARAERAESSEDKLIRRVEQLEATLGQMPPCAVDTVLVG
jgi:hypothetical protein